MHFICPLCQSALAETASGLSCEKNHHFDRAKEGYFNLLPVHHKNSRAPGDARLQLQSRRQFLAAGYFDLLIPAVLEQFPANTRTLLDIGCGEGYFTRALASGLSLPSDVYGIDIAKDGVKMASKTGHEHYAVASAFALPLASNSMDAITRIYAPSSSEELRRVLTPEGRVIVVTPANNHLYRLREQLYETVRPHPQPAELDGFARIATTEIVFPLNISAGEMSAALLQMTPFAWKMPAELTEALIGQGIDDEAGFQISVYQPA